MNLRILVCRPCMDKPQEQLRTIILPPDPEPVQNPRQEQYTQDDNPISSIGDNLGTLVQVGGLAAAFDSNTNKPFGQSACLFVSTVGYTNTLGKDWTTDVTHVVSNIIIYAPNDAKIFGGGACNYKLQGSDDGTFWTDIFTGTTAGTIGEIVDEDIATGDTYQYHQIVFDGDGINSLSVAQLIITVSS